MSSRSVLSLLAMPLAALSLGAASDARADADSPIRHVVVIFQENVSFDHYFGTYPSAANSKGEPQFHARRGTPTVNGYTPALLNSNPNQVNPFRFARSQAATCDQDHDYTAEQKAYDKGAMDLFVETLGDGPGTDGNLVCKATDVMGYYDGNTVTALWNYAQHFAMSDNSYSDTFGPSTPGAVNLVSGDTHGAVAPKGGADANIGDGSITGDARPFLDDCSPSGGQSSGQIELTGTNVGTLLNARHVTWGWFQGGFRVTSRDASGNAICGATHTGSDGLPKGDYIPHHEPFQYYASTTNQHHLPPSSVHQIGRDDQANHQYDIADWFDALDAGNFPAVSFLKAPGFQDGHAGYSDPLAEQAFLVKVLNTLQNRSDWRHTAVIILYDDSDGWYDHQMGPLVSPSATNKDALSATGLCGNRKPGAPSNTNGRCGVGPRQPLLVISPWAKKNFVDHTFTQQSSVLRFIEDNFDLGQIGGGSFDALASSLWQMFDFRQSGEHRLFLDPSTGEALRHDRDGDDDGD
jgi:phospholipase C